MNNIGSLLHAVQYNPTLCVCVISISQSAGIETFCGVMKVTIMTTKTEPNKMHFPLWIASMFKKKNKGIDEFLCNFPQVQFGIVL